MLHGVLSDGTSYDCLHEHDSNDESEHSLVGERLEIDFPESNGTTKKSFWVKARTNNKLLASYGKGFNVWNVMV